MTDRTLTGHTLGVNAVVSMVLVAISLAGCEVKIALRRPDAARDVATADQAPIEADVSLTDAATEGGDSDPRDAGSVVDEGVEDVPSADVETDAGNVPVQIRLGSQHSCVLMNGGNVYCWGANHAGQIGDGTTADRSTPTRVLGLRGAVSLAVGAEHTCVADRYGVVLCWGANALGQLGDGTTIDRTTATEVPGLSGIATVAAGAGHTCGRGTDTTVRCWGDNRAGQLGDGTRLSRGEPRAAIALTDARRLALGASHSCALRGDGRVSCWGENGTPAPTEIAGLAGVTEIAAGHCHTCAVASSGTLCWGCNANGQLGDGTTTNRATPALMPGSTTRSAIVAGDFHNCASTGSFLECWGANARGQLGDNSMTDRPQPVVGSISRSGEITAIGTGGQHSCAWVADFIWCWGANTHGQLGNGATADSLVPIHTLPW